MDVKLSDVNLVTYNGITNVMCPKWENESSIMRHLLEVLDAAAAIRYGDYIWYKNIPKLDTVAKVDYVERKISFMELLYTVTFNGCENDENLKHVFNSLKYYYKKEI